MIIVDTGPLVALFDPADGEHERCREVLRRMREPLITTIAVLTEAFHILEPASNGSDQLRNFVRRGGLSVWLLDQRAVERAFDLMEEYSDHPMDLADASLVVAAERLETRKIFTIDRNDLATYRFRRGHRHYPFTILG